MDGLSLLIPTDSHLVLRLPPALSSCCRVINQTSYSSLCSLSASSSPHPLAPGSDIKIHVSWGARPSGCTWQWHYLWTARESRVRRRPGIRRIAQSVSPALISDLEYSCLLWNLQRQRVSRLAPRNKVFAPPPLLKLPSHLGDLTMHRQHRGGKASLAGSGIIWIQLDRKKAQKDSEGTHPRIG